MYNKRGQGLSTNAIILIVLGVVILAVLILGFTVGWSKILPFVSTNNIDNIRTSCKVACSIDAEFDFCSAKRELRAGDVNLKEVTCNFLAEKQSNYGIVDGGIESCGSIQCGAILSNAVTEKGAMDICPEDSNVGGEIIQYIEGDTMKSYSCPVKSTDQ